MKRPWQRLPSSAMTMLKQGMAFPDNVGFVVELPNRRSFSPDAAFWTGGAVTADFLAGAPIFAVEVRSPDPPWVRFVNFPMAPQQRSVRFQRPKKVRSCSRRASLRTCPPDPPPRTLLPSELAALATLRAIARPRT